MKPNADHFRILDALEERESALLSWGDVDGYFTSDELHNLIEELCPDLDSDDVIDDLIEMVFIYDIGDERYRTRVGQGIYLFKNLRQSFHERSLQESRPLVSDFRYIRRQRLYPKRNISIDTLLQNLSDLDLSDVQHECIRLVVGNYELASFQQRSTERILFKLKSDLKKPTGGSIICAGTGSGKTIAFYLPALSLISEMISKSPRNSLKVLAVYPRNELLKDQFNECLSQLNKINLLSFRNESRPIRIGAFFGDVPRESDLKKHFNSKDFYSHWSSCPKCNADLRLSKNNFLEKKELLTCSNTGCDYETLPGQVAITRESLQNHPADILFVGIEVLNQRIGDPKFKRTFGLDGSGDVKLILLDEVHLYEGNQGVQSAYVLRRWSALANLAPHFVGLSATLTDAEGFFSNITGVSRDDIELIEPHPDELESEGAEYLLALKGDPVSETATLSVAIQATMLMRRLLDKMNDPCSDKTWGPKTFIFTDDLDITNRLFGQLKEVEGLEDRQGNPIDGRTLAQLRNPASSSHDIRLMEEWGQDWSIAKEIGFSLDQADKANITRTSSQDKGVNSRSDVVVSSPSLEVGYNDKDVGSVIQYKSPRGFSGYLQRKGRAGRERGMRPWMLVVLSDYGRDRVSYQQYERLVSPEIKPQLLPLTNSHIQKIQACISTLDYLSQLVGQSVYVALNMAKPSGNSTWPSDILNKTAREIELILSNPAKRLVLELHLKKSLRLSEDELHRVLWVQPRPLILEFLPLVKRRIETNWRHWVHAKSVFEQWSDFVNGWGSPVPEHIPSATFNDLNLPEITILLNRGQDRIEYQSMPFYQGLKEFSPGRVSKRFSVYRQNFADWCMPPSVNPLDLPDGGTFRLNLSEVFSDNYDDLGEVKVNDKPYKLIRPRFIRANTLSENAAVTQRSNSILDWRTQFAAENKGYEEQRPLASLWNENFKSMVFYTHRSSCPISISRFAIGADVTLKLNRKGAGNTIATKIEWEDDSTPTSIGAISNHDAVKFNFKISHGDIDRLLKENSEILNICRLQYFHDLLRNSLKFIRDPFLVDRIYECFIAAVAIEVFFGENDAKDAIQKVLFNNPQLELSEVPLALLNIQDGGSDTDTSNLVKRLQNILVEDETISLLASLSKVLYAEDISVFSIDPKLFSESTVEKMDFHNWLMSTVATTLEKGIHSAVNTILPALDEKMLISDGLVSESGIEVYLSEIEGGGSGVITQLEDEFLNDNVSFMENLRSIFLAGGYESGGLALEMLLDEIINEPNGNLARSIEVIRNSQTHGERVHAIDDLKTEIRQSGYIANHDFVSLLFSRLIKPGSTSDTDEKLSKAISTWKDIEENIGFEVPLNVAALILSILDNGLDSNPKELYKKSVIYQSLLWPKGSQIRNSSINSYNQFSMDKNAKIERLLITHLFLKESPYIKITDDDSWIDLLHKSLIDIGSVNLLLNRSRRRMLSSVIAKVNVTPLHSESLLFYPRCSGLSYEMGDFVIRVEFAEVV